MTSKGDTGSLIALSGIQDLKLEVVPTFAQPKNWPDALKGEEYILKNYLPILPRSRRDAFSAGMLSLCQRWSELGTTSGQLSEVIYDPDTRESFAELHIVHRSAQDHSKRGSANESQSGSSSGIRVNELQPSVQWLAVEKWLAAYRSGNREFEIPFTNDSTGETYSINADWVRLVMGGEEGLQSIVQGRALPSTDSGLLERRTSDEVTVNNDTSTSQPTMPPSGHPFSSQVSASTTSDGETVGDKRSDDSEADSTRPETAQPRSSIISNAFEKTLKSFSQTCSLM